MSFLDLRDVEYSYDSGSIPALRGVSLSFERGEHAAICGRNGSGKTTLAYHLNGLLTPQRGSVSVGGLDTRERRNLPDIRTSVAMVFQRPEDQIVGVTVEEDTAFGPENLGVPVDEVQERIETALRRTDLWELRKRSPHGLSGGQKQRLAIAGALALKPDCLVLDEATAMLDPGGRSSVERLVAELNATGVTIIEVTHSMEQAALARRIVVLDEGLVVADDTPRALFADGALAGWGLRPPRAVAIARRLSAWLPASGAVTFEELAPAVAAAFGVRRRRLLPPTPANETARRALVSLVEVSHAYEAAAQGEWVPSLENVSFSAGYAEAVALVGATGSGKSTLLQHLNALYPCQSGSLLVDGEPAPAEGPPLAALRRRIGLVFQTPEEQLFEHYVGDEIAYGPRLAGLEGRELTERVRWAMEQVGLPFRAYKDRRSFGLSGGEQRKVALAGTLALRPQALLLDEPTSGLDPAASEAVLDLLTRLAQEGTTLVLSTHEIDSAFRLARRFVALSHGRVAFSGPSRELFASPEAFTAMELPVPDGVAFVRRLRELGVDLGAVASLDDAVGRLEEAFAGSAGESGRGDAPL